MHTKSNRFSWLFLVLVSLILSVLTPAAHAAGDFAPPPPAGKYIVRANDTLWAIANQSGTTVAQLTATNPDVNPEALRPGQTLSIPMKTPPVSVADYTVKPNDTLWNIATKYGLFVNDLLAANPGVDPKRLMAGQILLIPGNSAKGVPADATRPVNAKYTVRPDDTLWEIAGNYGLSVDELLAANPGVDPRRLMAGQQVVIPGISQEMLSVVVAAPAPPAADPIPATEAAPPAAPDAASPPAEAAPAAGAGAPPPDPAVAAPPPPPAPAPAADISPMAQEMLNRINETRAAKGRAALVWNPQIAAAAQGHADDCAGRNRGSHVGSDGARLTARFQRVGYPYSWHGENWANARSVDRAMQMWMNEPPGADPHVRNILEGRAREIGIGIAKGAWGYYFITDFGSR